MNNKLTEFVKENKKAFEEEGPPAALWNRIETGLNKQSKSKAKRNWYRWVGAAAILLATVSVFTLYQKAQKTPVKMAYFNPAARQQAALFVNQIEEKKDSLAIFLESDPALYAQFNKDLSTLASDYEKLKKQLKNSPNKAFVVRAMLKNLELQSQVLSQQLIIFGQVDQYKKENSI